MTLAQTGFYFLNYPRDSIYTKALVSASSISSQTVRLTSLRADTRTLVRSYVSLLCILLTEDMHSSFFDTFHISLLGYVLWGALLEERALTINLRLDVPW